MQTQLDSKLLITSVVYSS